MLLLELFFLHPSYDLLLLLFSVQSGFYYIQRNDFLLSSHHLRRLLPLPDLLPEYDQLLELRPVLQTPYCTQSNDFPLFFRLFRRLLPLLGLLQFYALMHLFSLFLSFYRSYRYKFLHQISHRLLLELFFPHPNCDLLLLLFSAQSELCRIRSSGVLLSSHHLRRLLPLLGLLQFYALMHLFSLFLSFYRSYRYKFLHQISHRLLLELFFPHPNCDLLLLLFSAQSELCRIRSSGVLPSFQHSHRLLQLLNQLLLYVRLPEPFLFSLLYKPGRYMFFHRFLYKLHV